MGPVWSFKYKDLERNSERTERKCFFSCLFTECPFPSRWFSLPWLLQIPEELQLPGSEPYPLPLRSNQWNRTSGATDICRCRIHGAPGCPVQAAGYQAQALPAAVSRTPCGPSLFVCLLFRCCACLSCFLPPRSALLKEVSHLTYCLCTFRTPLLTAGQQGLNLCNREAEGDWSRGERGGPDRRIRSWESVRTPSCLSSKLEWCPSTSDGYFCVPLQCHFPGGSLSFVLRKILSCFSRPYYYSSFLFLVRNVYRLKIMFHVALSFV